MPIILVPAGQLIVYGFGLVFPNGPAVEVTGPDSADGVLHSAPMLVIAPAALCVPVSPVITDPVPHANV